MSDYADRFEAKFVPEPMSGCWLWIGAEDGRGYGQFFKDGRMRRAHRVSYELARGSVPNGLVLDHLCRTRSCVNPDHLQAVTQRENLLAPGSRSVSKANAQKTHCPAGHELAGDNLDKHHARKGRRICRACINARAEARRIRR